MKGRALCVVHCPALPGCVFLGKSLSHWSFPPSSANGVKDIAQNAHCLLCCYSSTLSKSATGRALPSLRGTLASLAPHGHAQEAERVPWVPDSGSSVTAFL